MVATLFCAMVPNVRGGSSSSSQGCPAPQPAVLVPDATQEFNQSVTQAIEHFKQNSDDNRVVQVYSLRLKKWFHNSIGESSNFVPLSFDGLPFCKYISKELFDLIDIDASLMH